MSAGLGLSDDDARVWLLSVYHLDKKVEDHLKKKNVLSELHCVAVEAGVDLSSGVPKAIGVSLYKVATSNFPAANRPYLAKLVVDGRLKQYQVPFAIDFLKSCKEPLTSEQVCFVLFFQPWLISVIPSSFFSFFLFSSLFSLFFSRLNNLLRLVDLIFQS